MVKACCSSWPARISDFPQPRSPSAQGGVRQISGAEHPEYLPAPSCLPDPRNGDGVQHTCSPSLWAPRSFRELLWLVFSHGQFEAPGHWRIRLTKENGIQSCLKNFLDFSQPHTKNSSSPEQWTETYTALASNSSLYQQLALLPVCSGDNTRAASPAHPQPVWSFSFLSICLSFPQACLQRVSDGDKSQLNWRQCKQTSTVFVLSLWSAS